MIKEGRHAGTIDMKGHGQGEGQGQEETTDIDMNHIDVIITEMIIAR